MGSSVSDSVADDDLDRHVAELILKEAKQKAERYGSEGYKAYLPGNTWYVACLLSYSRAITDHTGRSESNAPKTNKRFLSSIIKNTDEHNKTILRAQAQAAQEVRLERLEQEKKERRARAEEAVEAERLRRLMGKGGTEWGRDRERGERREKDRKRRERSWERREDEDSEWDDKKGKGSGRRDPQEDDRDRRRRHRSGSPAEDEYERRRRRRSRRERSRSPRPSRHEDGAREDDGRERRHRSHRSERSRSRDRRHRSRRDGDAHARHRSRRRDDSRRKVSTVNAVELDDDEPSSRQEQESVPPSPGSVQQDIDSEDPSERRRKREETVEETPRKRPRSTSPSVTARSTSKDLAALGNCESHLDTPEPAETEDDALRKQFDDKIAELRAKLTSKCISQPRASSSRHHSSREAGSSSSRTLPSAHSSSPSPGPRSPSPSPEKSSRSKRSRHKAKDAPPPPPTSPPPLPAHLPSKMDKYFEESYDPRLDVAPLAAPSIPATGLISDAEFAGWDAMLEVIRRRREDKEDKKRLERMGIGKDKSKDSKKGRVEDTTEVADIMSIEYKKRGAVREWDLGKEGF